MVIKMKNEIKYVILVLLTVSSAAAFPTGIHVGQMQEMPQFGDIIYDGYSAYVVEMVDSKTAYSYSVDFGNFPQVRCGAQPIYIEEDIYIEEEYPVTRCITTYRVVDQAPGKIIEILKSNYKGNEKQILIWAALGVDDLSLQKKCKELGVNWKELKKEIDQYQSTRVSMDLKEAAGTSWITLKVTPQGYSSVSFQVQNYGKGFFLLVERGRTLVNHNQQNQNIALGETKVMFVPVKETRSMTVRSYCINQHKGSPSSQDETTVGEIVEEELYKVISAGDILGKAASGAAQQAVWHRTDNNQVRAKSEAGMILETAADISEEFDWDEPDVIEMQNEPDIEIMPFENEPDGTQELIQLLLELRELLEEVLGR
jgi:hypothetical protein